MVAIDLLKRKNKLKNFFRTKNWNGKRSECMFGIKVDISESQ
jgi:hypothetical protein